MEYLGSMKALRPQLLGEARDLRQGRGDSVVAYCDRARALLPRLEDAQVGSAQMLVTDAFLQALALDLRKSCLPTCTLTNLAEHGLDRVVDRLKTLEI
jgi:hypothetical protein